VANGRHMTEDRVREETRKGPFIASEARAAGFVDGEVFDDEIDKATKELVGRNVPYEKWEEETEAPPVFGTQPKVAVIYVDGDMVDGKSSHVPIVDMRLVGSYTIQETVNKAADDPMIRAVVLRIESPGGSSLSADVMWRALVKLAEKKPLI